MMLKNAPANFLLLASLSRLFIIATSRFLVIKNTRLNKFEQIGANYPLEILLYAKFTTNILLSPAAINRY